MLMYDYSRDASEFEILDDETSRSRCRESKQIRSRIRRRLLSE